MSKVKTKTFGPSVTFEDGSTYPMSTVVYDFIDENLVSEETVDVDDHGAETVEYVFKDPETGSFYRTTKYKPVHSESLFEDLNGDLLTCVQVEPKEVMVTEYFPVYEDE